MKKNPIMSKKNKNYKHFQALYVTETTRIET